MADELYSNCVILDFSTPITRAQLDRISKMLVTIGGVGGHKLPPLRQPAVCGYREGNSVVPTICADEC